MTFTHFHEKIQQLLKNVGVDIAKRLTYQKFVHSWYAFLKLLDVTHNMESGLACSTCGPHPDEVVVDGTSVGFQEKFLPQEPLKQESITKKFR